MAKKKTNTLDQVVELLDEYARLEQRAEKIIEDHISGWVSTAPGVPRTSLRTMAIDAHAQGYSHPQALRHLRKKLEKVHEHPV